MTVVYFVRHAQSDNSVSDPMLRPLTEKGWKDRELVTAFLDEKQIDAVFSSPLKRAVDTLSHFAEKKGISVETIHEFREHETILDCYDDNDYFPAIQQYWSDMEYRVGDDESLAEVQRRNISALNQILTQYRDQNLAVGTHGIALSMIINYYDQSFGYQDFLEMVKIKPWVVKMEFDGYHCINIEKINLFLHK